MHVIESLSETVEPSHLIFLFSLLFLTSLDISDPTHSPLLPPPMAFLCFFSTGSFSTFYRKELSSKEVLCFCSQFSRSDSNFEESVVTQPFLEFGGTVSGLAGFVLSQLHMKAMVVPKCVVLVKIQSLLCIVVVLPPKPILYVYYHFYLSPSWRVGGVCWVALKLF